MSREEQSPPEVTNVLLGKIAGHLENVSTEIHDSATLLTREANARQQEWEDTLLKVGEMQAKHQRIGLIVLSGIVFVVSTVMSVLVNLIM